MSDYLLEISIGPVQEFIAAARRTRDLWLGSRMLSELAKSAAKCVMTCGGRLIFPSVETVSELDVNSELSVANVILAEFSLDDPEKLREISASAYEAAKSRLRLYADDVRDRLNVYAQNVNRKILELIDFRRFDEQLDEIIEFYSAWVPVKNGDYKSARRDVSRLLAARKNIRDFQANPCTKGLPKGSLDGLRENVFIRTLSEQDVVNMPQSLQLKNGESLDAIGLIKRVHIEGDEHFPAVSETASESYTAFLCADGDRMGAALGRMTSPDEHREFSRRLSEFALSARRVIDNHDGVCIYTGGDDVLAFLPIDKVLRCSRALHELFDEKMGGYEASLSVGVSIAHEREDLGLLRKWAGDAETAAKKGVDGKAESCGEDRDGLAVSVRSRGSDGFCVREQWKVKPNTSGLAAKSLDERLMWFAGKFMKNQIPVKFPYELRENANFYDGWSDEAALKSAIVLDVLRIFDRKEIALGDDKPLVSEYIKFRVRDVAGMRTFADELITAQWLSMGIRAQQKGESHEVQNHAG